jgi:hypothetical protein
LSQELQEQLIPIGAMPIAFFVTKATETSSEIMATSATFAETGSSAGTIFTFAYF